MPLLSYTSSIIGNTPEDVAQLNTMFGNVREVVNALDDDNIANGAGIQYSKLALAGSIATADLASGLQVPWTKIVNPSGPVAINDSGASAISALVAEQSGLATLATDDSTFSSIVAHTPPAGSYLFIGKCRYHAQTSTNTRLQGMLSVGGVARDWTYGYLENNVFLNCGELVCIATSSVNGSDLVKLMATAYAFSGPGPAVQYGRLFMIRVA